MEDTLNNMRELEDKYERLANDYKRLATELGFAKHKARYATIGHEQLNRNIAVLDAAGFRDVHFDEQVRRIAEGYRALKARFDLAAHLERRRAFSLKTFGPGSRSAGVVDHIRKELHEIEADPTDVEEWIDVIILAFDGAWRAGYEPDQIVKAIISKQTKNEKRRWPDWRTADPDKAIEHDRSTEQRDTFAVPTGYEAVFDDQGRATGELRPIETADLVKATPTGDPLDGMEERVSAYLAANPPPVAPVGRDCKFQLGDLVAKVKGSKWTGRVVGFYSTALTPVGYAVESDSEIGSVQIYPEAALASVDGGSNG